MIEYIERVLSMLEPLKQECSNGPVGMLAEEWNHNRRSGKLSASSALTARLKKTDIQGASIYA
jgi:hypothetical protein